VKELKKQLKKIELNISKSKVINNPDYSQRTPLLHTYYVLSRYLGWPNILSIADAEDKAEGAIVSPEYTPHLRSIREVTGYRIKENGKDTSYIVNFLIDKNDWTIKFTIVNMRKFLPGGKKALISTSNVNLDPKDPTAILAE